MHKEVYQESNSSKFKQIIFIFFYLSSASCDKTKDNFSYNGSELNKQEPLDVEGRGSSGD